MPRSLILLSWFWLSVRAADSRASWRSARMRPVGHAQRLREGQDVRVEGCEPVPREAFRETIGVTVLCALRNLRGVCLECAVNHSVPVKTLPSVEE
jgi:hypothetical protein